MDSLENVLLITDLDGTLLPSSKCLAEKDLAVIDRFRSLGGKFSIATGRTRQAAERYIKQLQLDMPAILFNGAAIYDPVSQTMLEAVTLPKEAVEITKAVLDTFPQVSAEILRIDGTYVPRMTPLEKEHLEICQVEPVVDSLNAMPKDHWLKVLFTIDPKEMQELIAFFQKQDWTQFGDFMQSEARFYEMLPKGVTKGSALTKYRAMYSKSPLYVIAVGDFDNDLEMLHAADLGVCPSNAQPCVKEAASLVLENSCETNAIAELVDRIIEQSFR